MKKTVQQRPKVRKCSAPGCSSRSDQPPFPLFHHVPFKNKKLRKFWLNILKTKEKEIKRKMFVCHKHFEKKYIAPDMRLIGHSFPTLFTEMEIKTGYSKRFLHVTSFKDESFDPSDHDYCKKYRIVYTPLCDHTYSFTENVIEIPTAVNKTDNTEEIENMEGEENQSENNEIEEIRSEDKEENSSNDKEKEGNISEEKYESNPEEKKKQTKQVIKKKRTQSRKPNRPLYFINENKENKTSSNNPNIPNIVIFNNQGDNNSTNNNNNNNNNTPNFVVLNNNNNALDNPSISNLLSDIVTLANNPHEGTSSKLYKLLVDNNIINTNAVENDATYDGAVDIYDDNGAVDNNDGDNISDPKMVIDSTENSKNIFADDNQAVDHTEVIDSIVQNNLTNEQILEKIMTEINNIKHSLSDTITTTNIVGCNEELREKLDINDMALINYNNTVVLCRKSDVVELKTNYPHLVDKDSETDQNLLTKVKKHRFLRHKRRNHELVPSELNNKQARNEEKNTENEDQEAVKNIPCDTKSSNEHRNSTAKLLIFCDDCKREHHVNDSLCKHNKPQPNINTRKKIDRRKRYITIEKLEKVNEDIQKLVQTTQQIQGQINSLTTVLTSLVTAVSKIEKERDEMKKPKPRKPRQPRKKKVDETLPVQETLPVEETLPIEESLPIEGSLPVQDILPMEDNLSVNENLPIHRHLPVNNEYIPVKRHSHRKRHLPFDEFSSLLGTFSEREPSMQNLTEQESVNEYLPESRRVKRTPSEQGNLRAHKRLPVQERLPDKEYLPVQGTLSVKETSPAQDYLRANRHLPVNRRVPVNRSLPIL